MTFLADLADLFPHTLTAQPGTLDEYGAWSSSGAALSIPCQIEGQRVLVRDAQGRQVVSSVQVICGEYNGLDPSTHKFTLPSGYSPTNPQPIAVDHVSDESGLSHEVVFFA